MIWIQHRVNLARQLQILPADYGVEMDLRSDPHSLGSLHLEHDPWKKGEDFRAWAEVFKRRGLQGPIILNTKEDGLETRTLEILQETGIDNFFFLDTTLPTLVKWTQAMKKSFFAVRYSEYEPKELAQNFAGQAEWLWVDCFGGRAVEAEEIRILKQDFKICLVSPELQGFALGTHWSAFSKLASLSDAICTKTPEAWQSLLEN